MISQVLAMDLQTSGTGSSGGAIALSIILLIAILFFLIRWSLKKYFINKRNNWHPIASFLWDNIHNHRSKGYFQLHGVKELQWMINLLLPKECPIQLK